MTPADEVKPLIWVKKDDLLTDRSRIVQDWKCPRSGYWQYRWDGTGIVPNDIALELFLGTTYHDALARIADAQRVRPALEEAVGEDVIAPIAAAAGEVVRETLEGAGVSRTTRDFPREQGSLVEGIVAGFGQHIWPRLMAAYPIIRHVEEEMLARRGRVVLMSRPDLVVAAELGDPGWYLEYKGTSSVKPEWVEQWPTAVQVHSGVEAVRQTTGVAPHGTIIQGLHKGYEKYGRQQSPFCWGYVKAATPPFTRKEQVSYEYRSGWERVPVWERPGGVSAWIKGMPENMLAGEFPQTPPIFLRETILERFLYQMEAREIQIEEGMWELDHLKEDSAERVLDNYFPQRFDQCKPGWGKPCPYLRLCHGQVDSPLEEGFVRREPHHQPELERWQELGLTPAPQIGDNGETAADAAGGGDESGTGTGE